MTGQKGFESTLQELWLDSCISARVALPAPALVSSGLFPYSLPDKISGKKKKVIWMSMAVVNITDTTGCKMQE